MYEGWWKNGKQHGKGKYTRTDEKRRENDNGETGIKYQKLIFHI